MGLGVGTVSRQVSIEVILMVRRCYLGPMLAEAQMPFIQEDL
jgi:hypothetical protein